MLGMPAGILGGGLGNKLGGANAPSGGGPPPFSPADVAGGVAWFDFSDPTTLFVDAGVTPVSADADPIYQANDKFGNGNNVIQTTLANRPLYKTAIKNGLSVGRAAGAASMVKAVAYSQPFTIFTIASTTNSAGVQSIVGANQYKAGFTTSNTLYEFAGVNLVSAASAYVNNTFYILQYVFNGASSAIYRNGVSVASGNAGAGNPTSINLFCTVLTVNHLTGDIGEFILYNGLVSAPNAALLLAYLSAKWAI